MRIWPPRRGVGGVDERWGRLRRPGWDTRQSHHVALVRIPSNPLLLRSPKITLEQQVQKRFRELWIIVYMLIELEVTIDHVLKQIIIFPHFTRFKRSNR